MSSDPGSPPAAGAPLLEIDDLSIDFRMRAGTVHAVRGVSLSIRRGETVALVGESGCGKSVTSMAVMRLLPTPPAVYAGGAIRLHTADGSLDVLSLSDDAMRRVRGRHVAMIFQEPMTSLNPVFTVGDQIAESLLLHGTRSRRVALDRACEMLDLVGIPEPRRRLDAYPHELSGGMRQRVMIAMALSCNPSLVIADEPTTALDVTIQAQILDLMARLRREIGMAMLFITHDLGVVAEVADRVVVMYAGEVVEDADAETVLNAAAHPYTRGLLRSLPRIDLDRRTVRRLPTIAGTVPDAAALPTGCAFHPRCVEAQPGLCDRHAPTLDRLGDGRLVRCLRADNRDGRRGPA
jgi:oligopeptide transport system ATP-binding protein